MSQKANRYLAFDLGASSGRAIVGSLGDGDLTLQVIHRFGNGPVRALDGYYWDVLRLFDEMLAGLGAYRREFGHDLQAIGIDTWGVDFALLGRDGQLLGNPHHYRDPRTDGVPERVFERMSRETIFERTGIQFMAINSLYQLYAMRQLCDPILDQAATFLMIPDLFNYWLTGRKTCEFTDATTTQMYDPRQGSWATDMLKQLDLPTDMLLPPVQPGSTIGSLVGHVAEEYSLEDVQVVAPACHDTGSAVVAVPSQGGSYAYISSGTWSLMGVEVTEPIINSDSLAFNLTNEGGVFGTYRVLKNIMGLWLLQECRRTWAQEGEDYGWDDLVAMAEQAPAFGSLIEPDAHEFLLPGDMPARIRAFCQRTNQPVPDTKGQILRTIMESLACKYRSVLENLDALTSQRLETVHIVGGGCQNKLLCQFAANAMQRPVVAGPVEATAIGNILMQALSRGDIGSLAQAREVVRQSFSVETYQPAEADAWDAAFELYMAICAPLSEV